MGQDNAVPRRINRVEGAAGDVMVSGGPGVLEIWHPREIPDGRPMYGATHLLIIPGVNTVSRDVNALTLNRIYYYPIYVKTAITIDQVTHEITVAAGGGEKGRFAIYAADINWQPGVRQVASAEFAIDAVAVVAIALAATTLQAGRYLTAITIEGNATLRTNRHSGAPYMGYIVTMGANLLPNAFRVNAAYAVLPDPGTFWDTVDVGSESFEYPSFLRVLTP